MINFPNIRRLIMVGCVSPVTSCEAERSFLAMRRMKTYLRSTMREERLAGLTLITSRGASGWFLGSRGTFMGKANQLSKTLYWTLGQQKMHVGSLKYCCDRSFLGLKYMTLIFASGGFLTQYIASTR